MTKRSRQKLKIIINTTKGVGFDPLFLYKKGNYYDDTSDWK
nr:MAG TPA_asm: hypothetical protein [Caudoviricetes sp.]